MCNQKIAWQHKLLQWNIVCCNYGYSHQMIFVAEDFIAMEHSVWQLVLFPRSNGVAILSCSCNTMFGDNIVYCHNVCRGNNYYATMLLVAISPIATISCVAFVFCARCESQSIATHQNWVAITYCNIYKCHDSQRNQLWSICYVLQPKHPYCNHS